MLTISDTRKNHHCQGSSRRDFLRIGSLGMFSGLGLPELLAARARAATGSESSSKKQRSVVLLFLSGGPSHIEFFDPKMTAPEDVRSMTGEVKTKLPGITFGGTFTKLANMTDKLAIVRSYASMNADHSYLSVTSGGNPLKASMGAMYARVVGNTNPTTGIPTNALVLPEAVESGLKLGGNFETGALPTLTSPGDLGPSYAAFDPSGGDQLKKNLKMSISEERFSDRRHLLAGLDTVRREVDASGVMDGLDRFQQQAFDVIVRGVGDAFDISTSPRKTRRPWRSTTRPACSSGKTSRSGTT